MNKKSLVRLIVIALVAFVLVKLCTSNLGSVITLPGGMGGGNSSEESGGWFSPKTESGSSSSDNTGDKSIEEMAKDIERQLGIGKEKGSATIPSTTPVPAGQALTFKGIPISGSLSEFGAELVRAGFRNAGNGTYTGDFAGYSQCKITPIGNNPVQEVRIDFPVISDWNALEKSYDSLQASLTQKYGVEPAISTGSNTAVFTVPGGTITLDADVKEQSSWHVILKYSNQYQTSSSGSLSRNPIDDL